MTVGTAQANENSNENETTTIAPVQIEEVTVTAAKTGHNLSMQPISATVLDTEILDAEHITAIKNVSSLAPNFYAPDYGSRTTSSIYVRGLGARIDHPVVGLNVDNVPVLSKDAYDIETMDIERMEILRGPQSTLYGRNTMGGLINIYTLSPLTYQGTRIGLEYGNGNTGRYRASHYARLNDRLGLSIGGYYSHSSGFFENLYTAKKCDWQRGGGGRFKLQYYHDGLHIENTFAMSGVKQGGYPYIAVGASHVDYNDPCGYQRLALNDGLTIRKSWRNLTLTSITSYQYLDDELRLDNDFTPEPFFTLTQARKEHALTEDIVLAGKSGRYHWLAGAFGFYRHADVHAPVTMGDAFFHSVMPPQAPSLAWENSALTVQSRFSVPTYGAALYHESKWTLNRWELAAGVRVDYEAAELDYRNLADAVYSMTMPRPGIPPVPGELHYNSPGRIKQDFLQVLPRITAAYRFHRPFDHVIYASVSEGHKAGGFNTQMFSEIVQQEIMSQMMNSDITLHASDVITYKPEQSWNYEIGTHLSGHLCTSLENRIWMGASPDAPTSGWNIDASVFYIDVRNQQLTVFPEGQTTGRMMTNAGRSRSFGAEVSGSLRLLADCLHHRSELELTAAYGYTNATFLKYTSGANDYKGNYVPYAPRHTVSASATYRIPLNHNHRSVLALRVGTNGAGRIYWDEANTIKQSFYALLDASVRFERPMWSVELWAKNATDTKYNVFYFVSMGNSFLQHGLPRTFGVSFNLNI